MSKEVVNFLRSYLILCLKYNIEISSCGCCSSPFILYRRELFVGRSNEITDISIDFNKRIVNFDYDGEYFSIDIKGNAENIEGSIL